VKAEVVAAGGGGITRAALWDCHVHVFEPGYPFVSHRSYTPAPATVAELRAHLDRVGAARAVVVQASPHGEDNRAVIDAMEALGPEHRAVIAPAPGLDVAALTALRRRGVRGLRLNPMGRIERADRRLVERLRRAARLAAEAGLVLELAATAQALVTLADELRACPCELSVAHLAGLPEAGVSAEIFERLSALVVERRIWVKLSGADRYPSAERVAAATAFLAAESPDRLLWGSDWPHTVMHAGLPVEDETPAAGRDVDDVRQQAEVAAGLCPAVREQVFRGNPSVLYG
jgi:predicted TIM-barrel fold metal-dependent hydrolase